MEFTRIFNDCCIDVNFVTSFEANWGDEYWVYEDANGKQYYGLAAEDAVLTEGTLEDLVKFLDKIEDDYYRELDEENYKEEQKKLKLAAS
ncbi:MAG: hypothetical protein K6D02_10040 [Lachnospiraceae bacterium]|nr:hypothetical protein [Lachnospiraceae bacterium]